MANRHRGETPFRFEGRTIALRLTLASLAELEDSLGAGDLAALGERLGSGRLSARDIVAVLAAGFPGAGERVDAAALAQRIPASDLGLAAGAAIELLAAAFGGEEPVHPPSPQVP